jgi:purine-binding chemotaxis protein CheW
MVVVHGAQLTFVLGDEEYGLPLARVVEIAPDEGLTRLPAAPDLLLGVVDVRGVPVPVVDLARKFGVAPGERGAHRSLIVVESELAGPESLIAIAADQISRVIEPRPEDVEPVPALSSGIRVEFLRGMVKSDRGFVLLLDLELVLSATEQEAISGAIAPRATEAAAPNAPRGHRLAEATAPSPEGARRFVVVRSGELQCGVDAAWVQEVTPAGGVTGVPGSPASFHGLHNLRGSVVPVLDLGAVMGQAAFTPRERSAFLVLDAPGAASRSVAALAVEAVMGMVEVGAGEIDAVPAFSSQAPAELVEGAALSLGRPTLILDLKALFAR